MRTPAGKDCRFYHQDFHRGRNLQECRLAQQNPYSMRWRPVDCSLCPVPDILKANADKNMDLTLTIKSRLLGLGRKLEVTARCVKHNIPIDDPYVGCDKCNAERPGLNKFFEALAEGAEDT